VRTDIIPDEAASAAAIRNPLADINMVSGSRPHRGLVRNDVDYGWRPHRGLVRNDVGPQPPGGKVL
jgi:hypothetical protein